jgi:GNAT superfamily N-acetyltransferase
MAYEFKIFNYTAESDEINRIDNDRWRKDATSLKQVEIDCNVDLVSTICIVMLNEHKEVIACMFYRDTFTVVILEVICVRNNLQRQGMGRKLMQKIYSICEQNKVDIHLYAVLSSLHFYTEMGFKQSSIQSNCDPMCKSKYLTTKHMVWTYPGKPTPIQTRSASASAHVTEEKEEEEEEEITDGCTSACVCDSAASGLADIDIRSDQDIPDILQSLRKRKIDADAKVAFHSLEIEKLI